MALRARRRARPTAALPRRRRRSAPSFGAASGLMRERIEAGEPADVFASADIGASERRSRRPAGRAGRRCSPATSCARWLGRGSSRAGDAAGRDARPRGPARHLDARQRSVRRLCLALFAKAEAAAARSSRPWRPRRCSWPAAGISAKAPDGPQHLRLAHGAGPGGPVPRLLHQRRARSALQPSCPELRSSSLPEDARGRRRLRPGGADRVLATRTAAPARFAHVHPRRREGQASWPLGLHARRAPHRRLSAHARPDLRRGPAAGVAAPAAAERMVTDSAGRAGRGAGPDRAGVRRRAAGLGAALRAGAGEAGRLVARAHPEPSCAYLAPAYRDLPELGRLTGRGDTANLEVVLASKPDLILDFGRVARHLRLAGRAGAGADRHSLSPDRRPLRQHRRGAAPAGRGLGRAGTRRAARRLCREPPSPRSTPCSPGAAGGAAAGLSRARPGRAGDRARGLDQHRDHRARRRRSTSPTTGGERRGIAKVQLEQVLAWDPDTIVTWDRTSTRACGERLLLGRAWRRCEPAASISAPACRSAGSTGRPRSTG